MQSKIYLFSVFVCGVCLFVACREHDNDMCSQDHPHCMSQDTFQRPDTSSAATDTGPPPDAPNPDTAEPPTPCTAHTQCAPLAQVCSPTGFCVEPQHDLCRVLAGDLNQPDVFVIGSLLPLVGREHFAWVAGPPVEQSIHMAVDEINQGGGLLAGRKLVYASCDTQGDPDTAQAAAAYLTDTLGVSAIIGPALSVEYQPVCLNVAKRAQSLLLSASATSPAITGLSDDGFCWRVSVNDAAQSKPIYARIKPIVEDTQGTVLILATDDAYGAGLRDGLLVEPWPAQTQLKTHSYAAGASDLALIAFVEQVVAASPASVVVLAGSNSNATLLKLYEDTFRRAHPNDAPPRYWLSESTRYSEGALLEVLGAHADLNARVEGVSAALHLNTDPAQDFKTRFLARYGEGPSAFGPAAYDAVYALTFAASALDIEPITGLSLGAWLPRLGMEGSPTVEAGPTHLIAGQIALAEAGSLDLQGASGPVRFDASTGDRVPVLFDLWVPTRDPSGTISLINTQTFDGVTWSPVVP